MACGIKLIDINKIDPWDYSFSVNVAFIFSWVDNRVDILDKSKNILYLDLGFLNHLWTPDFYIYDLKLFKILGVLQKTGGLRVMKQGNDTGKTSFKINGQN